MIEGEGPLKDWKRYKKYNEARKLYREVYEGAQEDSGVTPQGHCTVSRQASLVRG
jgi:hypothetical protein